MDPEAWGNSRSHRRAAHYGLRIYGLFSLAENRNKTSTAKLFSRYHKLRRNRRRNLGGAMKTDLNSLKKELGRLTDINYLKKELNRIASEVKKFDVHLNLTPHAKERLEQLEKRFREAVKSLQHLQKQLDSNVERIMKSVRGTNAKAARAKDKKTGRKKTSARKTSARKSTGK